MANVKITYKSDTKEFAFGTSYYDVGVSFNVPKNVLAVSVDNVVHNLGEKIKNDQTIEFIDLKNLNGRKIYKSGVEFLFEIAVKNVLRNAEVRFEHSVPKGVLATIVYDGNIGYDELSKIKDKMSLLVAEDKLIKKLTILKNEAIDFYKKRNCEEKAYNIQAIADKVVNLYELDKIVNYYYSEMPYRTSSITQYEIKNIGNNRVIIILPDRRGRMPDYTNCDNIIKSFYRGKVWLDELDMEYLANLNKTVCNGKIKDFIKSSELVFDLSLANAAKKISDNKNIKVVLIAGPSSSGKTTTCKRLADYLRANGYDPIKLSTDDYFVNREENPKDEYGNNDFECLTAIDLELFNNDLDSLLKGNTINVPSYNFITGEKEWGDNFVKLNDKSIIIIEGLHALNDELTPKIAAKYKYKIYLSPFIPLNIDRHNYVSTIDLRLIRRAIRDNRTRGYSITKTLKNWQIVRNGEEKYIFPYIPQADMIINTALPYEVGVLKVHIAPLLYSVDINSEYYEEARRLINFLKPFYTIPGEYVNENSILREFIGGKYD